MADTQQGKRQAWMRAAGSSSETYDGDIVSAATVAASSPAGTTINGHLLNLANQQLGTSYTNINEALQAWAAARGAYNWSSVGDLTP